MDCSRRVVTSPMQKGRSLADLGTPEDKSRATGTLAVAKTLRRPTRIGSELLCHAQGAWEGRRMSSWVSARRPALASFGTALDLDPSRVRYVAFRAGPIQMD